MWLLLCVITDSFNLCYYEAYRAYAIDYGIWLKAEGVAALFCEQHVATIEKRMLRRTHIA